MGCLIARGHIDEETLEITIPEQNLIPFEVPRFVDNMSYESLVIRDDRVYALFEAYGDSLIKIHMSYQLMYQEKYQKTSN